MDTQATGSTEAFGSGRFLLGHGTEGTCGHVDLTLRRLPEAAGSATVEWGAGIHGVPEWARLQILSCVERYLVWYVSVNPVGGLHAVIVGAGWSDERRNEPERAAVIALHDALRNAGLPPLPLYAPPTDA